MRGRGLGAKSALNRLLDGLLGSPISLKLFRFSGKFSVLGSLLVTIFVSEVEFYREVLGISYELGSKLRRLGALTVDAQMKDNRPLFELSAESIARHQNEITAYRLLKRKKPCQTNVTV